MLIQLNNVLSVDELEHVQLLLDKADWTPGHLSAGTSAKKEKSNEEVDQQCSSWKDINKLVATRLYQHHEFQSAVLPHRLSAAFISRYKEGMSYKAHVDNPIMGTPAARYRSDVAITVFLSDADSYTGGELLVHTRFGPVKTKLPAGCAVAYPASSLHEVTEIQSGERLACVLWAQSLVRDAHQREILADLKDAKEALNLYAADAKVTNLIDQTYMNLVRMWSDI